MFNLRKRHNYNSNVLCCSTKVGKSFTYFIDMFKGCMVESYIKFFVKLIR